MVFNQIYGEVNDKLLYQFYIPIVIFNCWIIYHTVRKVVVLYIHIYSAIIATFTLKWTINECILFK